MNKFISWVAGAAIICSCAVIPVQAEEAYPDYVPTGEIAENLFLFDDGAGNVSASRNFMNGTTRNTQNVDQKIVSTDAWVAAAKTYAEKRFFTLNTVGRNNSVGYEGLVISNKTTDSNTWFDKMTKLDPSKSYVLSFTAKNVGSTDARLGVAISNEAAGTVSYSADYGYEGIPVPNEYTVLSTAIKPSADFSPENTNAITIGFPEGTAKDTEVYFNFKDANSVYFAEEIPYDISNTLVSEEYEVCVGEDFLMRAAVLNQVGTAGCLEQDFTWIAMDKAKTAEVEGFAFTVNDDGTTSVDVAEDVAVGEYALVAVSNVYDGFAKTAYIEVKPERIVDVPLEGEQAPDNLILTAGENTFYQASTTSAIELGNNDDEKICTVKAKNNIANANSMNMDGMKIRTVFNRGFAGDFNFTAGETYVVSAKVRKSAESTEDEVKFVIGLGQKTAETFSSAEEITLTDEWQEIKTKITAADAYDSTSSVKEFYLGMPDGTKAGSAFDISYDVYIAKETLSGFAVMADNDGSALGVDDALTVTAAVTNQLGTGMSGYSQEFNWYVLNERRNDYVEEIRLDINEEKNAAVVKIDEFAESGIYYIVAEQGEGEDAVRGSVQITVETPLLWEYVSELTANQDSERLSRNLAGYAEALGITSINGEDCNAEKAVEILLNNVTEEITAETELIKQLKRAMAVSLFCENPNDISLAVETEMALKDIDTDGVTIASLFESYLSDDGKKELRNALANGNYTSFEEFIQPFAQQVILKTIEKPSVSGTGYVADVLTEKNTELGDIDADKYLSSSYKSQLNSTLARNSYTKEALEAAINNFRPSTGNEGGSGSSGGGGGSSSKAPSSGGVSLTPTAVKANNNTDTAESAVMFADVAETHWAYSDIYHLKQRGIVSGDDNNRFSPDSSLTREQFVKMLCEAFEYPMTSGQGSYSDVTANAWYAPYVNAATEQKIVNGVADNVFGIGSPITRQDLCVIVYRAMGAADDLSDELAFTDTDNISGYAKAAVAYLNMYDVVNGFEDDSFRPQDNCTRAQAAKILCKILNIKGVSE